MNLQKATHNRTVQKVVAVSSKHTLEDIRRQVEGLPQDFSRALAFWSVDDVLRVSSSLESVQGIIERLELIQRPV